MCHYVTRQQDLKARLALERAVMQKVSALIHELQSSVLLGPIQQAAVDIRCQRLQLATAVRNGSATLTTPARKDHPRDL